MNKPYPYLQVRPLLNLSGSMKPKCGRISGEIVWIIQDRATASLYSYSRRNPTPRIRPAMTGSLTSSLISILVDSVKQTVDNNQNKLLLIELKEIFKVIKHVAYCYKSNITQLFDVKSKPSRLLRRSLFFFLYSLIYSWKLPHFLDWPYITKITCIFKNINI